MIVTNQTTQDLYFGPLHLVAGVGQQLTIDDTSATSLYLLSDSVADALNNAYQSGKITVASQAQPFPRPTGTPKLLHGDGSPEGLVYAPQGSIYMRRDAASTFVLYVKTSGVTYNTQWIAVDTTGASVPTGAISQFGGSTSPSGWLLCDGSAVSRTTYAALFAAVSTTYGPGDGSTTFNVPDLRGRVAVGYAAGGKTEVATLGNNDGLAENLRNVSHHHTYTSPSSSASSGSNGFNANTTAANTSGDSNNTDKPAYLVVNHIIKI